MHLIGLELLSMFLDDNDAVYYQHYYMYRELNFSKFSMTSFHLQKYPIIYTHTHALETPSVSEMALQITREKNYHSINGAGTKIRNSLWWVLWREREPRCVSEELTQATAEQWGPERQNKGLIANHKGIEHLLGEWYKCYIIGNKEKWISHNDIIHIKTTD